MRALECDVLVVGGGGAGLRAAIAAAEVLPAGRVILATKGRLGASGVTATACSDRMAFHATLPHTEPGGEDAWRYHAEDIYRIGGEVSDWDLAEVLARDSAAAYQYLDELGVPFVKREGQADQFLTDGSTFPRACYTGPRTANHMEQALIRRLGETTVQVLEDCLVVDVLVSREQAQAAGALALQSEALLEVRSPNVVLATGGAGSAWAVNSFPDGMTGDGYAIAYRAGCPLVNMEFVQIGLCSVATKLACSGSMMRALPRLVNDLDEEFLGHYFPPDIAPASIYETLFAKGASWPMSYEHPSHVVDVAVFRQLQAGRRVYLDYGHNPQGLNLAELDRQLVGRFPSESAFYVLPQAAASPLARLLAINRPTVDWLRERGIDLHGGDRVEIAPAAQHFQGGVKIDRLAATALPGLYAAGECAGGQHGANRPGGHSLLDSQVFGRIAGEAAAGRAGGQVWRPELDGERKQILLAEMAAFSHPGGRLPAALVRERVQAMLSQVASVVRAPAELARGLDLVASVKAAGLSVDGHGLSFCLETRNLLAVAEVVLRAAATRRESRGPHLIFAHSDSDTPLPHDEPAGKRYVVVRRGAWGEAIAEWAEPVRKPAP